MEPAAALKKRQALNSFIDHLCHREVTEAIAKVVLFGSPARGECQADSQEGEEVYSMTEEKSS